MGCFIACLVLALGCGGKAPVSKADAGGDAAAGRDASSLPDVGAEAAPSTGAGGADASASVDGAAGTGGGASGTDGGAAGTGGGASGTGGGDAAVVDAASDGSPAACKVECPGGPCPVRLGTPVALARGPSKEHVAALAVGPDAVYFGTIAQDIFTRGRLTRFTPSTGAVAVVVEGVQVSKLQYEADGTLYYWSDEVQNPGVRVLSIKGTGAPMLLVQNDYLIPGYVLDGQTRYTERAFPSGGRIESEDPTSYSNLVQWAAGGPPHGLAVDDKNIYWTSGNGPSRLRFIVKSHQPGAEEADGTVLVSADDLLVGPIADGGNLYFAHQHAAGDCAGSVDVVPRTGGTPRAVSLGRSGSDVSSFAVDATFVYWTTPDAGGLVLRAPKAGGTPEIIASAQPNAAAVTVDATRVYWIAGEEVRAVAK